MDKAKPTVVVFGVGHNYSAHKTLFKENFDILALVDSDPGKQGQFVDGIKVEAPFDILKWPFDYIVVTPGMKAGYEIRNYLASFGIPIEKMRFVNSGGVTPFTLNPLFFALDLSKQEKMELFAENVERVVIEINSKCNRQCWFCPNSIVDRHTCNIDMADKTFCKIIDELKSIDYDGAILLSYFNEPLCCTKLIDRIKHIRSSLPESFIYAFSNGDYLERKHLVLLSDAGLDLLWIDIYTDDKSFQFNDAKAKAAAVALYKRIGLSINIDSHQAGVNSLTKFGNMDLHFIARDFQCFASNRAESLPDDLPIPKITSHPLPCIKTFISFHIDYTGGIWPCPNYHCDIEKHGKYNLGNVNDESIFDIYLGFKMNAYREQHLFHRDILPCKSCIWNFYSFVTNRFDRPFRDRPLSRRKRF